MVNVCGLNKSITASYNKRTRQNCVICAFQRYLHLRKHRDSSSQKKARLQMSVLSS